MVRCLLAVAAVPAALLLAAGCGGSGGGSAAGVSATGSVAGTTYATTVATTTVATPMGTTTTGATASTACRQLAQAARQASVRIGGALKGLGHVRSANALDRRLSAVERALTQARARIAGVQTPSGPLTADKQDAAAALESTAKALAGARHDAANGNLTGAVLRLSSLQDLARLRTAGRDASRRCTAG